MELVVTDPDLRERLIAERRASGGDRFDEVWEGTYVMAPIADNEHQNLAGNLTSIFRLLVGWETQAMVLPGTNVSDREDQWEHNYRCPDVAVFLEGTSARDMGTHWLGGPDFAVEIRSPGDRSLRKLSFYASVGVRELLVIDRKPWSIELYRLVEGQMSLIGRTSPGDDIMMTSEVLPASFRISPAAPRPRVEVNHRDSGQRWQA
jgi:Uma2 family endonuclease